MRELQPLWFVLTLLKMKPLGDGSMRILGSFFISLATFWAHPAAAAWELFSDDSSFSCTLFQEFADDGDTQVLFSRYADGKSHFAVANRGWSAVKGEAYPLALAFDDDVIGAVALGFLNYPRTGFAIHLREEDITHFRQSKALVIFHAEDAKPIVYLSLKGSSVGLNQMDQCLRRQAPLYQAQLNRDAALERKRQVIPADPFAKSNDKPKVDLSQPGTPRGNPGRWVALEDMPENAKAAGWVGTTSYQLQFDEAGRVIACDVTGTSGYPLLDRTTCDLLKVRALFNAGKDADGNPVGGTYSDRVLWRAPGAKPF